jgi:hypothetical protein
MWEGEGADYVKNAYIYEQNLNAKKYQKYKMFLLGRIYTMQK